MSDINDIARQMGQQDVKVLSLDAAKALLQDKSHRDTSQSLFLAAKLDYMLGGLSMGSNNIGEVREAAEDLLESIDDDLGLMHAITTVKEADSALYESNEVAPIGTVKFVNVVHSLMELARGYLSGRCKGDMLCEAGLQASQICYNAYRNASIIETNLGSGFYMVQCSNPRPDFFDRLLVETVSTGAIGAVAMRPAILGSKKGPKDIFAPKKKNRWYLKYAIE